MGFLPLGDDNSQVRATPWLVWTIIAINAGVWLLQLLWGERFTNGWSVVPYELSHNVDVTKASDSALQVLVVGGKAHHISQYPGPVPIQLTLLSSMFMHGSWMHIIGNMLYLWIFGDQIEDLLGKVRFVLFYLLCGLLAGIAQVAMDPESIIPNLGASGAIAGVLGAYLVKYPTNGVRVIFINAVQVMPAFLVLGAWIALQVVEQWNSLAVKSSGGVAYMAHIGGFVAGMVLVFVFSGLRRTSAGGDDDPPAYGGYGRHRPW
jgi:membrane associated rhomboid family serine protease